MSFSNYAENLVLSWLFTTAVADRPTTWFAAVHTADPGEDGTTGELTASDDTGFVRKSLTYDTPTEGNSLSLSDVTWSPATAGPFVITHVSIWDDLTAGNCLISGALLVPRSVTSSSPMSILTGDLVAALD